MYSAIKLTEYCYGFLLQNMVALLTYDDSVKRLLFSKKLPNNDVLNGLLQTLQMRIKHRRSVQNPGHAIRPALPIASANKIISNKWAFQNLTPVHNSANFKNAFYLPVPHNFVLISSFRSFLYLTGVLCKKEALLFKLDESCLFRESRCRSHLLHN